MAASNYDTHTNKSGKSMAARLGALTLIAASFGSEAKASEAPVLNPPEPAAATQVFNIQAENPIVAAPISYVRDVHELVDIWSANKQLYVSGHIPITQESLNRLAEDLKAHPNWTVYLVEKSQGTKYTDSLGNSYKDNFAVEHALGKELRAKSGFTDLKDGDTGQANGNILYISFDSVRAHRKVGFLASEAYDSRGLGEAQWSNNLDSIAIRALKDDLRVYDAVMNTVTHLDSKLAAAKNLSPVISEPTKINWESLYYLAYAGGALAVGGAALTSALGIMKRLNVINHLKEQPNVRRHEFAANRIECEELKESAKALFSEAAPQQFSGETGQLLEKFENAQARAFEIALNGITRARELHLTARNDARLLAKSKINEIIKQIYDGLDGDSLEGLKIAFRREFSEAEKMLQELQESLEDQNALREEIESKLEILRSYALDSKLSKELTLASAEANNSWVILKDFDREGDPVGYHRRLTSILEYVEKWREEGEGQLSKYDRLMQKLDESEAALKSTRATLEKIREDGRYPDRVKEIEDICNDNAGRLEKTRSEITSFSDDSWLLNYAMYLSLFQEVSQAERYAEPRHSRSQGESCYSWDNSITSGASDVGGTGTSDSNFSSSNWDTPSSSPSSSIDFGSMGGFDAGSSGFSSSGW